MINFDVTQDNLDVSGRLGNASLIEVAEDNTVRTTVVGDNGIKKTFFRIDGLTPVILSLDGQQKYDRVLRFSRELTSSDVPLLLKTKSRIGDLGEEMYLGFNARPATAQDQSEFVNGKVLSTISFCVYACGTDFIIPHNQYGLIGHRDLVLAEDELGEFVYTDKKLPVTDYYPSPQSGWKFWDTNLTEFSQVKTIERWHPADYDPYNVGIGSLLQGAAVSWIINYQGLDRIKTDILLPDGKRMWEKYGLDTTSGVLNRSVAINQIVSDIGVHIR